MSDGIVVAHICGGTKLGVDVESSSKAEEFEVAELIVLGTATEARCVRRRPHRISH